MEKSTSNVFWYLVIACYAVSVFLSYARIYVFHAYPIYYSEEDMPSLLGEFFDIPKILNL